MHRHELGKRHEIGDRPRFLANGNGKRVEIVVCPRFLADFSMTDKVENLTHEMLQRIHGKSDEIQTEIRLWFSDVESGLAAIE